MRFSPVQSVNAAMLPRISLRGINLHLSGRRVLTDVTWSLAAGEHWAFVGANGSGKSTLLRVIAGTQWVDYDGGARTYSPDGFRLDTVVRAATWIRHVSAEQHERYARLDLPLAGRAVIESGFDDSVYVHRPLGGRESERVDALIERFALHDFALRPMRELSSGQLRRVLIARAIVREPRVLVLDEFTGGLDSAARHEILAFLDQISASLALVVASHRADDFPAAITHTATVCNGRIVSAASRRPKHGPQERPHSPGATPQPGASVLVRIRHADVYRGATLVLRDVNWELRRGEHTAIRGANGAGKTTFAGLIAGTIPAATGAHIVRFGQTGPFDIWKLKERVAHVSDDLQIAYDRGETVEAVIASGFPSSIGLFVEPTAGWRTAVADVLGRIGLEDLRGRAFTQLSFGERRKVLIARSLVRRPAIFILDEVWNGLDHVFRQALQVLLRDMTQAGTTLLVIAHDADDIVALTPRVCTIENGTIREELPKLRAKPDAKGQVQPLARVQGPEYD